MKTNNQELPHGTAAALKKVEAPRLNSILGLLIEYGPQAFSALKIILPSIKRGDWAKAATDLLNTVWGRANRAEAERLAHMLATGQHHSDKRPGDEG